MWKLTIVDDEGTRTVLPLSRGEYAVGRDEDNTIRLTERNISRKHLMLRKQNDEGWVVEDLKSYNGCFVNGIRVPTTHPLYHGDLLQLGDYRLELLDDARLALEGAGDGSAESMPAPRTSRLLDRPDRLVVVDGAAAGTEFPLEAERIVIGRAEDVDISINHSSVSRIHAEIVKLGDGIYEIFDRGSSNGIRINGIKLERRVIEDDDEIEFGDVRLRFVSRGRIFRPGTRTRSHSLASAQVSGPVPVQRKGNIGLMVVAGALLGLVAVGAFVALRPTTPSDAELSAASADLAASVLSEAQGLAVNGHLDQAHAKLASLAEGSPLRESADVKEIEAKWADMMLAKADQESDLSRKRNILQEVAAAEMVDRDRRNLAQKKLDELDEEGTDPDKLPPVSTATAEGSTADVPPGLAPNPFDKPKPGRPKPRPTTTEEPTAKPEATSTGPDKGDPGYRDDAKKGKYDSVRRSLEPRVWSGRATVDEIRMLVAVCRAQRDAACTARARALLKEKQK